MSIILEPLVNPALVNEPKPTIREWSPTGEIKTIIVATDGETLLLGNPEQCPDEIAMSMDEYNEWAEKQGHNCDQMGCGMEHVLWRSSVQGQEPK